MKAKVQYKFLGYNLTSDKCKHINMFKIFECVHCTAESKIIHFFTPKKV